MDLWGITDGLILKSNHVIDMVMIGKSKKPRK